MQSLNKKTYTLPFEGSTITLETSILAKQANAAVIGRYGDTVVLATVVMGKEDKAGDFFPLSVDYEERFYAAGKIMGSRFLRREGRPSDEAVLSGRLIDRTIRPLFDDRLRREVQVTVTVLAYDETHDPDMIALLTASTALAISDVPWQGPVAGVRKEEKNTDGTLRSLSFFAGPAERINMIEFEGKELSEADAISAFDYAKQHIATLVQFQKTIVQEIGKKKMDVLTPLDESAVSVVRDFLHERLPKAFDAQDFSELKKELFDYLKTHEHSAEILPIAEYVFEKQVDEFVHAQAIQHNKRPDGRAFDEVRELFATVGTLPRTHGSAIFMRGDTQVLAVTTLASPAQEQLIETIELSGKRRFMLHYNFPNFSTGETKRSRGGPGRREIGHGALAHKALLHLIPPKEEFPYTIRVVAETLSSNGSSSQASICASCLSLMDAGVPIPKHVAGIAIGLMSDEKGNYKILTDIQGPEDHYGDMDFKVAGTKDGITAIQMDVKVHGITREMFIDALKAAEKARLHILETMQSALPSARKELSPYAPTIMKLIINPDKIGLVIGPGGKTINGIIDAADKKIDINIEEDGTVFVSGTDKELVKQALEYIHSLVREFNLGEIVEGEVIKMLDFGAIVDLGGGKDGMLHVSELKDGFVKSPEEVVHMGDVLKLKVVRVDPDGRIGLSLKQMPKE